MLPLKDENSTSHFPLITIVLMVCNITIFTSSLQDRRVFNSNIVNYGLVPSHLIDSPWLASLTVISSMFIYTGWNHLLENMLYLWVFGKNTEDILGMGRYTICYILCGSLAAFCHIATEPYSQIPMVGASGAISGVLGAYLISYPKARALTLVFFSFYVTTVRIPALVFLSLWLIIQIGNGYYKYASDGIAWFAHISGFLAGMFLIYPFKFILGSRVKQAKRNKKLSV